MNLAQLEFCRTLTGEALLAADLPSDPLAAASMLRRECDAAQAAAILEVRDVRLRAAKSGRVPPEWAVRLLATKKMLEQASSMRLAHYVGRQLAFYASSAGSPYVLDLCCGMGLDAIGIALAGATVRGCDISPEALYCAAHNSAIAGVGGRCAFELGDVAAMQIEPGDVVHVDPDRRAGGKRHLDVAGYEPSATFLRDLIARTKGGAIKLSPAMDYHVLEQWGSDIHLEYISEDGGCKQLLVWWGGAGPQARRQATIVLGDWQNPTAFTLPAGAAEPAPIAAAGEFILEPDPAIIAADGVDDLAAALSGEFGRIWRIDAAIDWLTCERAVSSPAIKNFRILREVAGRTRDVAAAVAELGGGVVEVKPRGVRLNTDLLQKELSGGGNKPLVVLWCRIGQSQRVFITERVNLLA